MANIQSPEMQQCIQNCLDCHRTCLQMAMNHCLEQGGKHTEPEHFRLMMACAEICQTSANMMMIGHDVHKLTCHACAEICARCADDCAKLDGMEECVQACRKCAESCNSMAV